MDENILYVVLKVHDTFKYSSIAQWQSIRLLTEGLLVRAQLGEFGGNMEYMLPLCNVRLLGQAVKTSPFHGGNAGSIPAGVIQSVLIVPMWLNWQSS